MRGRHQLKFGTELQQTRLCETFGLGITNPSYNPVCLDANGNALLLPGDHESRRLRHDQSNVPAQPQSVARIGPLRSIARWILLQFPRNCTISTSTRSIYRTPSTLGHFTIDAGIRVGSIQRRLPRTASSRRLGVSYLVKATGTVLRAAYSRTFETPFNENLLLSSSTGAGGLASNVSGATTPIQPGFRNQFDTGFQQKLGKYLLLDASYFWKYTHNAFDFNALFNTPITFPIAWHNSKSDGFTGRLSTVSIHGFQAYATVGHDRARYFPPEVGGLIPQGTTALLNGVFRIDHDQAFQQTTNLRYQHGKNGLWIDFIWRYDSGEVVSGVPDVTAATLLTPHQQVDIGFSCNGVFATLANPITVCNGIGRSTLLTLPQTGTENNDHNPDRVQPRNLFDVAVGTDNLLRSETSRRVTLRFTVANLTNKVALYNFLSTFSGTHFVAPRTYEASLGFAF